MTPDELRAYVKSYVAQSRAQQGLPLKCEDPYVHQSVAQVLSRSQQHPQAS
jgi:hypothetical protein